MAVVAVEQRAGRGVRVLPVLRLLRLAGLAGIAGCIAGFIAGGIGSRLAMRIVSLTAGREHYGELTEADARVGQITTEGTLFLLFFGGMIGIAGSLIFLVSRRWLPLHGWRLGLAFGGLLLLAVGPVIIDGGNFDFTAFGSPTLNVLLFAALFPLYSLLLVFFFERMDRRVPGTSPRGARALLWGMLLLFGSASALFGSFMLTAFAIGLHNLSSVMAVYLMIAAPLLAVRLARRKPAHFVARYVAAFPVLVGGTYLAMQLYAIYAA